MAKSLPPITINGTRYRVLRLDRRAFGPQFLLRDDAGRLFGLFEVGAEPFKLSARPLHEYLAATNPLERVEFLQTDAGLTAQAHGRGSRS